MADRNPIPEDIFKIVSGMKVIDAGFGAGPSCIAGKGHTFSAPVSFEEGIAWLEGYFHVLRKGHIRFVNGTTLWFDSVGYLKYDEEAKRDLPRPGVGLP